MTEDSYYPEAGSNETAGTVPQTTPYIPTTDEDLYTVAFTVNERWKAYPGLTLAWITQPEIETIINSFRTTLDQRYTIGDTKSQIVNQLCTFDKTIDDSIEYVKGYIADKYSKKDAGSYYKQFGIVKVSNWYKLPNDRDSRRTALNKLVNALTAHGMSAEKYGTAFWTPIMTQYGTLLTQSINVDSQVSNLVSIKNSYKEQIVKFLMAVVHLFKANFPEDYDAKLRAIGFQKEKY